jgi:hypothetical protein
MDFMEFEGVGEENIKDGFCLVGKAFISAQVALIH